MAINAFLRFRRMAGMRSMAKATQVVAGATQS
jgi:hypothetical protein